MKNKNKQNRNDLELIINSVFDEIMIIDDKFKIIDVNKTFIEKYDLSKKEAIGKKCYEVTHGLSKVCQPPECKCPVEEVFKTGKFNESIHSHLKKGEELFVEFLVYPLKTHEGKVSKVVKIGRDITERILREKEIKQAHANLNFILSNLNDSVITISKDFNIIYMNNKAINEFGKDFIGTICYKTLMKRDKVCDNCSFNKLITNYNDKTKTETNIFNTYQKLKKTYEFSCTPILNFNDQPAIIDLIRDISDQKQNEELILNSEQKFQEAYNRASLYKDILSHDINNIFQVIQTSIDLIKLSCNRFNLIYGKEDLVEMVNDQIKKGAQLISNIRKLSNLEDTHILLQPIEINEVLNQAIKYILNSFPGKEINIAFNQTKDKYYTEADDLLIDIFENILLNAVKHNHNSIIDIEISVSLEIKNRIEYIKIEFTDNGMGIPNELKEQVFQTLEKREKGKYGMGLGLSLVKKIINKYQGEIWVENRITGDYTKGSKFVILIKQFHSNEEIEKYKAYDYIKI